MNREDAPAQIRLGEDGELLEGFSCTHCGHLNFTRRQPCEQCGTPFPKPSSALRARLEALRQSEGKKKDTFSSQGSMWNLYIGVVFISWAMVFILGVILGLCKLLLFSPR